MLTYIRCSPQQPQQSLVVRFQVVDFDLVTAVALPADVQVLHGLLQIRHLIPQPVVLSTLHLQFILNVLHPLTHLLQTDVQHSYVFFSLVLLPLEPVDFFLPDVDFVLVAADFELAFFVHVLLAAHELIHFLAHFLNLLRLRMIYIRLSIYLFLTLLYLFLRLLVLVAHLTIVLSRLSQLNFHIT